MKRRLLVIFLTLCLILGLFPISASAADSGSLDVTTIYVSNQGGGDGASEKDPTTLESALETINRAESDTENPLKFIISITEDIEKTGTTDFYFKNHIVTLLGNGHKICTSGTIGATENTILYLGKADGSDSLTLEEIQRSQAHSVVSAGNGVSKGTVHMYDGVSVLGANDAFKNDSTGHGVRVNMGEFHMHGGEISGFCIPQPGAGVSVNNGEFYMYGGIIQNCMSKGGTQFGGGAIWGDGNSEIHILGGELKDNKADNRGGAIATQSAVAIEIKGNAKIIGNEANHGGAISIQDSSSLTITDEVEFSGNRCTGNGGAISALSGCAVTITGGTFKNNRSIKNKWPLVQSTSLYVCLADDNWQRETTYVYDGKKHKPAVTVKRNYTGKTVPKKNYSVKYLTDCRSIGVHRIQIKLKGDFRGTIIREFTIAPQNAMLNDLVMTSNSATVSWNVPKKTKEQITGYMIQYTDGEGGFYSTPEKDIHLIKIKNSNKLKYTIKGLTKGKRYFVRITTYKTVMVDGKPKDIIAGWGYDDIKYDYATDPVVPEPDTEEDTSE